MAPRALATAQDLQGSLRSAKKAYGQQWESMSKDEKRSIVLEQSGHGNALAQTPRGAANARRGATPPRSAQQSQLRAAYHAIQASQALGPSPHWGGGQPPPPSPSFGEP